MGYLGNTIHSYAITGNHYHVPFYVNYILKGDINWKRNKPALVLLFFQGCASLLNGYAHIVLFVSYNMTFYHYNSLFLKDKI